MERVQSLFDFQYSSTVAAYGDFGFAGSEIANLRWKGSAPGPVREESFSAYPTAESGWSVDARHAGARETNNSRAVRTRFCMWG
jgi:hypothetical protein